MSFVIFCVSSQKKNDNENLETEGNKRSARNPVIQVAQYYAFWQECNQHSFGLPLTLNGMHKTSSGYAYLDLLSLVICSQTSLPSISEINAEHSIRARAF